MSLQYNNTDDDLWNSDSGFEVHDNTDGDQGNSDNDYEVHNETYDDQWSNDSHMDLTHNDLPYSSDRNNQNTGYRDIQNYRDNENLDMIPTSSLNSSEPERQNMLQNELLNNKENKHKNVLGREQNTNDTNMIIIILVVVLVITLIALVVALLTNSNTQKIQPVIGKDCGSPPTILHGSYWISGSTPGAVSFYNCTYGYHGVGVGIVICQKDGQWSNINFVCQKDCSEPPHVIDSTYRRSGIYSFYRCHQGFYPVGESRIICQDGTWSAVIFKCSKYCGTPPNIPYSKQQISGYMAGAVTSYDCLNGYVAIGYTKRICNATGEWSLGNLTCLKDCSKPPNVADSTYDRSGISSFYRCHQGFYLVGESSIICKDGAWSAVKFKCSKYLDNRQIYNSVQTK